MNISYQDNNITDCDYCKNMNECDENKKYLFRSLFVEIRQGILNVLNKNDKSLANGMCCELKCKDFKNSEDNNG